VKGTTKQALKDASEGTLMKETAEVTLKGASEGALMQGTTKGALRTTDKIPVYWQQIIFCTHTSQGSIPWPAWVGGN